jgi:hypothetical protein
MIGPEEIRKRASRVYPDYLASIVEERPFFPLEIPFGTRVPRRDYHGYAQEREALLSASKNTRGTGYSVEFEPYNTRRYGIQQLPTRICFECEADYVGFLGRAAEAAQFGSAVQRTRTVLPELLPWLALCAPAALAHLDEWDDLLAVCRYFSEHPRPGVYPRELPIPVHTKFVEAHAGILRRLLDAILPEGAVAVGEADFARRFGLKYDEPLVRLRVLDPAIRARAGLPVDDLSTPVSEFVALRIPAARFVIVENRMTFLTLPFVSDGVALWGGGFRVELLRAAGWLAAADLAYWGDLDAHGFMILSQLRSFFPLARSLMMDEATLEAFAPFVVPAPPVPVHDLPGLTDDERVVYEYLARHDLRLEQERIPQPHVARALDRAWSAFS